MTLTDEARRQARDLVASRLGLAFPEARQADLERGLLRACRSSPAGAPEQYLQWLATLPDQSPEWRRLAGHLTVGETYFFRDRGLFDALEQRVLPALVEERRADGTRRLRLWSAGCATGEEAYSLAIQLDRSLPDHAEWAVTILATDINPLALDVARQGHYREWSFRQTPAWIRDRYFHRRTLELFAIDTRLRRMVTIAPLNLAEDVYPSVVTNTNAMDVILCRNVLMYFTREAQQAAVGRLERALVDGGWLAVSPTEASADLFRAFTAVNFPGVILYRKEATRAPGLPSPVPVLPDESSWWPPVVSLESATTPKERPAPAPAPSAPPCEIGAAPPDTTSPLARARALADRGDLEEAAVLCEAALARDRLDPEAHLLFAAICQERGQTAAAVEALRRAIYLAPDSAPAHFLLGSLLLGQGKRTHGRRSMETVVSLLSRLPRDTAVAGGDGLTAGRLLETARAYLEP